MSYCYADDNNDKKFQEIPGEFDLEKEFMEFKKMLQEEIDGFSQDGEDRTVYLLLREEHLQQEMRIRIARGESISGIGGEKAKEIFRSFDHKPLSNFFAWIRYFWTNHEVFNRIARFLDLEPIPDSKLRTEADKGLGDIEVYETNIPCLKLKGYRSYKDLNAVDSEHLKQIELIFSVESCIKNEKIIPEEFKIDVHKLSRILEEAKEFKQQQERELSNELKENTWIIKLHKLSAYNDKLLSCRQGRAGFTITPDYDSAFLISIVGCYGYFWSEDPIIYEDLIHELNLYYGDQRDIVQKIVAGWFADTKDEKYTRRFIKEIFDKAITLGEYEKINEIIQEGNEKTALGWLWRAKKILELKHYYSRAEEYVRKAKKLYPGIDVSEVSLLIEEDKQDYEVYQESQKILLEEGRKEREAYEESEEMLFLENASLEKFSSLREFDRKMMAEKLLRIIKRRINNYPASYLRDKLNIAKEIWQEVRSDIEVIKLIEQKEKEEQQQQSKT